MIEVLQLSKHYQGVPAVSDVDFCINKGEIVGLLGPNGAGKTTIMKMLTGFHFPSSGTVSIDSLDISEHSDSIKDKIGYLPENAPLYPELTVEEYLSFIAEVRLKDKKTNSGLDKKQAIIKVVKDCSLEEVYYKTIDTLSKGFRQRVGLAQAILHEPDILILDEPTTGLDPNQILEIRKLIVELGKRCTIILSTHILQEVEAVCTRVLILNHGRIVAQGSTQEIGNELRGAQIFELILPLESEKLIALLQKEIADLAISNQESTYGTALVYSLSLKKHSDTQTWAFQKRLFELAVKSNVPILGLRQINTSLEDVFTSLTSKQENKDE